MLTKLIIISVFVCLIYFRTFRALLKQKNEPKYKKILGYLIIYLVCITGISVATNDKMIFYITMFLGLIPVTITEYLLIKPGVQPTNVEPVTRETIIADGKKWIRLIISAIIIFIMINNWPDDKNSSLLFTVVAISLIALNFYFGVKKDSSNK